MEKADLQNILAELTNTNLVILGLSISIFTVVYSFLINKKMDLNKISERINSNQINPFDNQQKYFAINYIKQFSKINQKLLNLIVGSFLLFAAIFVINRFLLDNFQHCKELLFYVSFGLTATASLYFVYIFFDLIRKYKNEVSI